MKRAMLALFLSMVVSCSALAEDQSGVKIDCATDPPTIMLGGAAWKLSHQRAFDEIKILPRNAIDVLFVAARNGCTQN
jgi:uncharacterized protein YdeI (BOF family)